MMNRSVNKYYLSLLRKLVLDYVRSYPIKVYLYGSHAKGIAHRTSDIDIALFSDTELPTGFIAGLRELVEESSIPYQVDIVDLNQTDENFRNKVLTEGELWND